MDIDQTTLGARLRGAREGAKLTQDQVAQALSLPRTAIAQIEAGNRSVSSLELVKLAKLFGKDFADFFSDEVPETEECPLVVLHRLAPGLEADPEVSRQVQRCLDICREGKALEAILGREGRLGPPEYKHPAPRSSGDAVAQGATVAESERARLGLGDAPIADMPELLNAEGVWATGLRLPDQMSGLFLNHPSTGMVIIVNLAHCEERRRFSYAHEYGHALLDRDRVGNVSSKDNAAELVEKRANAFAASLLMPARGVMQQLRTLDKGKPSRAEQPVFDVATDTHFAATVRPAPGSQTLGYQDVALLADWFKVSYQAATYRLRSMDMLSQRECDSLIAQEGTANEFRSVLNLWEGHRDSPPKEDKELVAQVAHLAIEAYRREEISRGRVLELAELLGLAPKRLLSLAQAAKTE